MSLAPVEVQADQGPTPPAAACVACGERLSGPYCSSCGEAAPTRDSVGDIIREWARTVIRSDRILWSTLFALVADPGRLTRDWWEGRRARRMSPVRVLFTVMLFGTIVSWAEHLLVGRAEADIGLLLQVFTYQAAVVTTVVMTVVLPRLLPPSLKRTAYQHVTFGLYQSAVLGLMSCVAMLLLVFGGYAPFWAQDLALAFAPLLAPVALLGLAIHCMAHMRGAFGVSWLGAGIRTAVLSVAILITSLFASFVLMATGVSELWMPQTDGPMPRFERVAQP